MGVTFRTSMSEGNVWLGKRTVKEGECLGLWDLSGKYHVVEGPMRQWLWWSRFKFMDRHVADSHQYLVIQYRDGKKEHKRGPAAVFEDPVRHSSVLVEDAVTVDAFEVIVVYSEDAGGKVKRDIVHGPTVFIPAVNQWLHVFRWHGSPPNTGSTDAMYNKTGQRVTSQQEAVHMAHQRAGSFSEASPSTSASQHYNDAYLSANLPKKRGMLWAPGGGSRGQQQARGGHSTDWCSPHQNLGSGGVQSEDPEHAYLQVPGALKFTKLRTIADQFYVNAPGVRTADDASLTIKLMVFFAMEDLELMLNSTHDPIGDFINALLADVMNFGSKHTYEQFIGAAQQLSELSTFPVLTSRAQSIGFKISKVVYRGYTASSALQDLCDKAIRTRTELRLKQEEQEQAQRTRDHDLKSAMARSAEERTMENERQTHKLRLEGEMAREQLRQEAESARIRLAREEEEHAQGMRQEMERNRIEQAKRDAAAECQVKYLQGLAGMGVDLTKYLVAAADASRAPDKVLKVIGLGENGVLHTHAS